MLAWLGNGEALFPRSEGLSAPCVPTQPFLEVMHTHMAEGEDGGTHDYFLLLFGRAQILPSQALLLQIHSISVTCSSPWM